MPCTVRTRVPFMIWLWVLCACFLRLLCERNMKIISTANTSTISSSELDELEGFAVAAAAARI